MSNFTPSACYDLKQHTVKFNKKGVDIINTTTGKKVDGAKFADGFDVKVENGKFCFGTISFTTLFEVKVSLKKPSGGFEFDSKPSEAFVIGSDELDIPQVTKHIYRINKCPIRLKGSETVTVFCPCNTSGTPCTNDCYTKK